jgi:hypothetical protein
MREMIQTIRAMKQGSPKQTIALNLTPNKSPTLQILTTYQRSTRGMLLCKHRFYPKQADFHPPKTMLLQRPHEAIGIRRNATGRNI